MVPIVRRLVLKGVPLPTATAFMLAAPIINPVVAAATTFAFRTSSTMVFLRLGTAFFVAVSTGLFVSLFFKGDELKSLAHVEHAACGCKGHPIHNYSIKHTFTDKIVRTAYDASNEFFEMGKYLLIGAMIGSLAQILLPRTLLLSLGEHPTLSIGVMMLFAFCISVCSAADAFIAASFSTSFSVGSLVAFMVFGPMFDLKNTFMLLHTFRLRFVIFLAAILSLLCTASAFLLNLS